MGQGHSSTAFVGIDHRPAAQSYMPCHLFGNADLYGIGIRVSFYLQYFAAIVALAIGLHPGRLAPIRIGLAVVSVALFTALCINSTGASLVLVDWYVVAALVAPAVLATDYAPYVSRGWLRVRAERARRARRSEIARLVGVHRGREAEAAHAEAFLNAVVAVYRDTGAGVSPVPALEAYEAAARQCGAEVSGPAAAMLRDARAAADDHDDDGFLLPEADFPREVARGAADLHVPDPNEAHARAQALGEREAKLLVDGLHERERARSALKGRDALVTGILCLIWAAYQFAKPWLYFVAINRGSRRQFGCDVKVFWFFIPVSIYRGGFVTWLRITAVVAVLLGLAGLLWALYLLAKSLLSTRAWPGGASYGRLGARRYGQVYDVDDGGDDDDDDDEGRHRNHAARKRVRKHRAVNRWFALLQAIVLVICIGVVEGTLAINHLDMTAPAFGTTGQLMAFLVGLLTTIPLLWECLVVVPLRLFRRRHEEPSFEIQEKSPPRIPSPHHSHEEPIMTGTGQHNNPYAAPESRLSSVEE